ncbi:MAG: hypothetical protein K2N63_08700 [Lachnospiraceae bacterium]|nr:hypothetical protein [Lachnospiraceae bacterium]
MDVWNHLNQAIHLYENENLRFIGIFSWMGFDIFAFPSGYVNVSGQ